MPGTVPLIDPNGQAHDVPAEIADAAIARGWRPQTHTDVLSSAIAASDEATYGGIGGGVKASLAAGLRGATLGLSDVAARAIGGDDAAIELEGLREVNPGLSTGFEIGGALAPAFLTGGSSAGVSGAEVGAGIAARLAARTPAGFAARAGSAITGLGAEAGTLGKLGAAALGGAAEGALYGAGAGASELALSQDPLTLERAASTISSNALYGAGLGAGVGAAGGVVERGLGAAKRAIDDRLAQHADDVVAAGIPADISVLNKAGLEAKRKAVLAELDAARAPARQKFVDDLAAYDRLERDAKLNVATKGAAGAEAREAGAKLYRADTKVRGIADDPYFLVTSPESALRPLQRQQHALEEVLKSRDLLQRSLEAAPDEVRAEILAGKVKGEIGPFGPSTQSKASIARGEPPPEWSGSAGLDAAVERVMTKRYGPPSKAVEAADLNASHLSSIIEYATSTGDEGLLNSAREAINEVYGSTRTVSQTERQRLAAVFNELSPPTGYPKPAALKALDKIPALLEKNLALQRQLGELTAAPTSDLLTQIDAAHAVLTAPAKPPTLAERLLHRVPGAGLVSDIVGSGGKAVGGLRAAVGKAVRRTGEAVSAFSGAAQSVTGKATPVATKILSELSYSADAARAAPSSAATSLPALYKELPALYKERTDEIKRLTAYDETGTPRLRPEARRRMAERLQPIRVVDPILGDRIETLAARRIEYLSSIIPRQPDWGGLQTGPSTWHPSDMAMQAWARAAHAVEDPGGVEERLADGVITPEDAAAYWAVYPERALDLQRQILALVPGRERALPYAKRLALSIFTGKPVDPTMHPRVIAALQSQFPAEPGTSGGAHAPRAAQQLGSLSKNPVNLKTPAQERQGT